MHELEQLAGRRESRRTPGDDVLDTAAQAGLLSGRCIELDDERVIRRERGLLTEHAGRARLTEAGFLLSDALFTELL